MDVVWVYERKIGNEVSTVGLVSHISEEGIISFSVRKRLIYLSSNVREVIIEIKLVVQIVTSNYSYTDNVILVVIQKVCVGDDRRNNCIVKIDDIYTVLKDIPHSELFVGQASVHSGLVFEDSEGL